MYPRTEVRGIIAPPHPHISLTRGGARSRSRLAFPTAVVDGGDRSGLQVNREDKVPILEVAPSVSACDSTAFGEVPCGFVEPLLQSSAGSLRGGAGAVPLYETFNGVVRDVKAGSAHDCSCGRSGARRPEWTPRDGLVVRGSSPSVEVVAAACSAVGAGDPTAGGALGVPVVVERGTTAPAARPPAALGGAGGGGDRWVFAEGVLERFSEALQGRYEAHRWRWGTVVEVVGDQAVYVSAAFVADAVVDQAARAKRALSVAHGVSLLCTGDRLSLVSEGRFTPLTSSGTRLCARVPVRLMGSVAVGGPVGRWPRAARRRSSDPQCSGMCFTVILLRELRSLGIRLEGVSSRRARSVASNHRPSTRPGTGSAIGSDPALAPWNGPRSGRVGG